MENNLQQHVDDTVATGKAETEAMRADIRTRADEARADIDARTDEAKADVQKHLDEVRDDAARELNDARNAAGNPASSVEHEREAANANTSVLDKIKGFFGGSD